MTSQEMSLEFDILYNNIASNMAPGIDAYEKSVFLTKAQEQIVTAIYDGSFEGSEKLRECINPLVETKTCEEDTSNEAKIGVEKDSRFFFLPEDAWYIVYEFITLTSTNPCDSGRQVTVKPIKVDEYHRIRRNPFRRARKDEVLRLNTEGEIEIVSTYSTYDYSVRYLRKPKPIIIGTEDSNLTINGMSTEVDSDYNGQGSELLDAIHRTIVETAVNLAIMAYKSTNN